MTWRIILIAAMASSIAVLAACGGPADKPNNALNNNTPKANAVNSPANTNTAVDTVKKPDAPTANAAPTIGPVVQAYYDALRQKNDTALHDLMSADAISKGLAEMKKEKQTSLAAYLASYEDLTKPIEVRNERINGDKAVAEIKGGSYINWTAYEFVNENGKWRWTGRSPDFEAVTQSSNSGK